MTAYLGRVVRAVLPTVSASSAGGFWNPVMAQYYQQAGTWPSGSGADPYFQNNTLLLSGDGTNGAQNNTFLDSSTNNFTVTRNGNTTQGSFSPYVGPGNWSNYFDGSGDYLTVASIGTITGDFTYECWIYPTSTAALFLPAQFGSETTGRFYAAINTSRTINLEYFGVGTITLSNATVTANTWNHFAITRSGSTMYGFINGALAGSTTSITGTIGNAGSTFIGASSAGTAPITGFISNFRVIAGTALYTAAFTPPTTPLLATTQTRLLTCNNNGFIDQGAGNYTITRNGDTSVSKFSPFTLYQTVPASYSGYFDGTGDYLSLSTATAFGVGTGDFTIEYWAFYKTFASSPIGFDTRSTSGDITPSDYVTTGGNLVFYYNSANLLTSTNAAVLGRWNHIAWVRSGTTLTSYINGVASGSVTSSANFGTTQPLRIAGNITAANFLNGSISNFRFVKGTAVYTTGFTPPIAPLTAISGTSLLTCQSTTFIDNSTNAFTITANGNATPRRANPFTDTVTGPTPYSTTTYGGSAYFDGTGDYLVGPASNTNLYPGAGDFTIEFWNYLPANPTTGYYTVFGYGSATPNLLFFYTAATSKIEIFNNATVKLNPSWPAAGQWNHFALVRSGTTLSLYINGAFSQSTTESSNFVGTLYIGADFNATRNLVGYIANFRLVKGTAVYTGPFVPPAAPVTAITNTQLLVNATNAGIFDNTTINDLETVGNAQVSTSIVKYGTGSVYLDGTGDWLVLPKTSTFSIPAASNFTVETWLYLAVAQNSSVYKMIVSDDASTSSKYVSLTSSGLEVQLGGSASTAALATYAFSINTWYHLAVVRNSNTIAIYVNGTALTVTQSSQANSFLDQGSFIYVGRYGGTNTYAWNGYLDDLRITKGVARYTANFTPPGGAFPTF